MDPTYDNQGKGRDLYELPCTICRRRKVRCSKTLPCNNCERAGATCIYDESNRSSRRPARHTELSLRLSRIESLVKNQNQLTKDASNSKHEGWKPSTQDEH